MAHLRDSVAKMEERLRAIYEDEHGTLPNLKKLDRGRGHGYLHFIILLCFLGIVAGAGWVGFLLFSPFMGRATPKISVNLIPPTELVSLETTTLRLRYENTYNQPLSNTELRLNLPPEFQLLSAAPAPTLAPSTWFLGNMEPHEQGTLELHGTFLGRPQTPVLFQTFTHYRPASFNADFDDISTSSLTATSSKLTLALETAPEVVAGEELVIKYRLKNTSTEAIDNVEFRLQTPSSFLITKATPAAKNNQPDTVTVGKIPAGGEVQGEFRGAFSSNHAETENLGGTASIAGPDFTALQAETTWPIKVIASDFSLRAVVNGSGEAQLADPGDNLRLTVMYKNTTAKTMKDVGLEITAASPGLVDWAAFDAQTASDTTFKRDGDTIFLNKKLFKDLTVLDPGEEGVVNFNLPLAKDAGADLKKAEVQITAVAKIAVIDGQKVSRKVSTSPLTVTLNSNLAITALARYFDAEGSPLGTGPLPPTTGEKTRYSLRLDLTNTRHELGSLNFVARLPEGVAWTASPLAEAGLVSYDEVTREVRWSLGRLGPSTPQVAIQFLVELTPNSSQIGSFAPLLTGGTLVATDVVTGALLTRSTPTLTTELIGDKQAAGKGLVRKGN